MAAPQAQVEADVETPLSYNQRDAARMLGISESTLRRWARDGIVPVKRIGAIRIYSREALLRFLEAK